MSIYRKDLKRLLKNLRIEQVGRLLDDGDQAVVRSLWLSGPTTEQLRRGKGGGTQEEMVAQWGNLKLTSGECMTKKDTQTSDGSWEMTLYHADALLQSYNPHAITICAQMGQMESVFHFAHWHYSPQYAQLVVGRSAHTALHSLTHRPSSTICQQLHLSHD